MANDKQIADAGGYMSAQPLVRPIGMADLKEVLAKGLADFNAVPTHLIFLCLTYPIVVLIAARIYAGYDVLPFVFPLLAGYTLIGPLIALGTYELSRRREKGVPTTRRHAFGVLRSPSLASIAMLGLLLMAIYFLWLFAAWAIYELNFGSAVPGSIEAFARQIFDTPAGWALITLGSGAGFIFATLVFTLSVVSFPLLLDRDVGVITAVQTSIRAVLANPVTMGIWGFVIAGALFVGSLPLFVGLAVVLPLLGHASWHLYRRVVEWPPEY